MNSEYFGTDDRAKYPFLSETGEYIRENDISVSKLAHPDFKLVVKRAEERVEEAINSHYVSDKIGENLDVEIMSFPVALMLVKATKLDHLIDLYASGEAKRVQSFLTKDMSERTQGTTERLVRKFLGLGLETAEVQNVFRIGLADYLKRETKFRDPRWRLVNRTVHNGKVSLQRDDLIQLIEDEMRSITVTRLKNMNLPKLPAEFDSVVRKLIQIAPPPRVKYTTLNIGPENYPPCLKQALLLLEKGENVPHYGRFLMATYLLAVGKSVDEIMDLFPKSPDFKKSVTQYQVEHIAGLKGGRTKYTVPSCKTLQTHSFCFKDPVKCYEISSPLQYPSRRIPAAGNGSGNVKEEKRKGWTKAPR